MSDAGCIFCAIASGTSPSYRVGESDRALAFLDINPATEGHTLVIPKRHAADIWDLDPEDGRAMWSLGQEVAALLRDRLRPDGMTVFQA
ncbi:MAG TPA: HIT domain-containing protein, partial [Actinomycetota bacterium]|nr:HIT domain-containing protein [Actinomycetota bacterium]